MRIKAQWSEWKFRISKGYWCEHWVYRPLIVHDGNYDSPRQETRKVPTWLPGDLGRIDGWRMVDVGRAQHRFCSQCGFMDKR